MRIRSILRRRWWWWKFRRSSKIIGDTRLVRSRFTNESAWSTIGKLSTMASYFGSDELRRRTSKLSTGRRNPENLSLFVENSPLSPSETSQMALVILFGMIFFSSLNLPGLLWRTLFVGDLSLLSTFLVSLSNPLCRTLSHLFLYSCNWKILF